MPDRRRRGGDRGALAGAVREPDHEAPAVRNRPFRAAAAADRSPASRCNPWTIPNAIGFVRAGADPGVPGRSRFSSADGIDALAAVLFAVIGWADYLDGFAARLTGQYSRLGALLDPIVDRLLVVSGMVVAWHFQLLPRWAIALVVARELLMLGLSRYGIRHGLELKINWAGRLGVAPTMGAPFFAMCRRPLAGADDALRAGWRWR